MASSDGHGTGRRTGGRQGASPAVYRRRRLIVLVLALLVVAALAVGAAVLTGLFNREPEPAAGTSPDPVASPTTTTEPDAVPSPTPTAATSSPGATPSSSTPPTPATTPTSQPSASATGDACGTDTVVVEAETDRESYGPDELPVLDLVVRNEGETPCVLNVGTSQMEFVLTLDDERVFSSTDCQDGSQDLERILAPDGEERAPFEWTRNRTVPGCTAVDEDPAGGTYTLVTRLGGRSSSPVTFTLE